MAKNSPTPEGIITAIQNCIEPGRKNIMRMGELLHEQGYHDYSRILSDFNVKIERAISDAVDELMED